jgi:hypothetical protein
MAQGILGFKYEEEKHDTGMTGLAGLPVYLDLIHAMGLAELIGRHLRVKERGWTDAQMITALMMLNIAGGDCVEDLGKIQKDEGFCRILRRVGQRGMRRAERRAMERRWRRERWRSVPSASAVFRYLSAFHDADQEINRKEGKAFIPVPNEQLRGLVKVNQGVAAFVQKRDPQRIATLDQDATLVETAKRDALFSYQGFKSYQPLNTWWAEQQVVLHTEFRDGNVPAGYEQLRVLKESLALLPEGVEQVRLRSDTAGYQHSLLRYCEQGEDPRFGRIEFAIGADVTPEFKKAVLTEVEQTDWQPIYREFDGQRIQTNQEWAEVCFVPNAIGHRKDAPVYRYLAIREPLGSMELPGMPQQELPFQTVHMDLQRYKLFGLVTNMDWDGERLIHWHRERCGKSEEAHSVMKGDFAGGKLPSGDFGENAAWWWIMILAMNLNTIMKRLVLGGSWVSRRMKAIRYLLITIPGRIVERSREMLIRLAKGHPALDLYIEARRRIMALTPVYG